MAPVRASTPSVTPVDTAAVKKELAAMRERMAELEAVNRRQAQQLAEDAEASGRLLARIAALETQVAASRTASAIQLPTTISHSDLRADPSISGSTSAVHARAPAVNLAVSQALVTLADLERLDDQARDARSRSLTELRRALEQLVRPAHATPGAMDLDYDDCTTDVGAGRK